MSADFKIPVPIGDPDEPSLPAGGGVFLSFAHGKRKPGDDVRVPDPGPKTMLPAGVWKGSFVEANELAMAIVTHSLLRPLVKLRAQVLKNPEVSKNRNGLQARFGAAVKRRRNSLGISQEELAWRAGLHRTYITDIERGVRNITLRSVASLAKALDVSMSSLLVKIGGRAEPTVREDLGEILMVEDNPVDAEMALRAFRKARFSNPTKIISDGGEALDYLLARRGYAARRSLPRPHVVLLDLNLPTVPGLDVLRQMKQAELTREIPVIVLTVSQDDQDIAECRRLGAESYIVKPVGFENFRQATSHLSFDWALLKAALRPRPKKAA